MWGRFDRIYLLSGDNRAHRRAPVMRELERVGIDKHPGFAMLRGSFPSGHAAHFRAIMDFANSNKGGRCLLLEDDIRFLKDLDRLAEIVGSAPNADIVSFDSFFHLSPKDLAKRDGHPFMYWTPGVYGTSCYSLSKVATHVLALSYVRHPNEPADSHLFLGHQDLCTVVSSFNACVQLTYMDSDNSQKFGIDVQHKFYRAHGVDYSLYNVPDGYGYGHFIDKSGAVI